MSCGADQVDQFFFFRRVVVPHNAAVEGEVRCHQHMVGPHFDAVSECLSTTLASREDYAHDIGTQKIVFISITRSKLLLHANRWRVNSHCTP
eukprot:4644906-Amphidinium_carterae.1